MAGCRSLRDTYIQNVRGNQFMDKRFYRIIAVIVTLLMMLSMTACGNKEAEEEVEEDEVIIQEVEQGPEVVKSIDGIDTEDDKNVPMQIESITLFEDGTVLVVPTDDLKKNEMKDDEDAPGIYPFADSGKVKDVFVVNYGNGGYRTIIALLEDGTISAVNGNALIQDHIIAVMNTVAGRENFVSIENIMDESAYGIIGHTEDGEDVVLDYSLDMAESE